MSNLKKQEEYCKIQAKAYAKSELENAGQFKIGCTKVILNIFLI